MTERQLTSRGVCFIHHVVELAYTDTYQECGECYHVFQTEQDLRDADAQLRAEMGEPSREPRSVIYACPMCSHDF